MYFNFKKNIYKILKITKIIKTNYAHYSESIVFYRPNVIKEEEIKIFRNKLNSKTS